MVNGSSRSAASNGGGVRSPQSQRRSFSPPWASVVRGDSEQNASPTAAVMTPGPSSSPPLEQASAPDNPSIEIPGSEVHPETPDANGDSNAGTEMSSVWKKPSNGVVEPASVMGGAGSWPALGETTRAIPKSSSENPRPVSDDGSASSLQVPLISQLPQRLANNTYNVHGNSTAHNLPTRQKSRNRNGGGGGSGGNSSGSGGPSQNTINQPSPPMPPPFPVQYRMVPAVMDTSVRGARPLSAGSSLHSGTEHSSPRNNNSRRGNYGSHRPRGDRHNHNNNNYGGRRDQYRDDVHHHPSSPQFVPPPRGYMAHPLPSGAVPFMGPPPVRIFPGGFDMAHSFFYVSTLPPESFRAMPLVLSPPPMFFPPAHENSLTSMIVKQIDFYFSDDNLVKDNFLRSNMDDQGWVPVGLIASFRRVQQLTQDIPVILESLRYSEVVEVQGDKLRRRDGWNKWLHLSARRNSDPFGTNAQSSSGPENELANSLQEVSLDKADCNVDERKSQPETAEGGILLSDLTGQLGLTNGKSVAADGI